MEETDWTKRAIEKIQSRVREKEESITEFVIVSEKIQPDRRIRFSLPEKMKKQLVVGKRIKMVIRIMP